MGWERDIQSPMFRALIVAGLLFAFGSIFLEQTPPVLMVLSQAFQAAILPAVAIPVYYLLNKEELVGTDHLPSRKWNAGLVAVIAFSLVTTCFAVMSF